MLYAFLGLQTYVVAILIALIVLQYAFALFCLLKLAYFDIERSQFILWNLFILLVFFIGGIAFLVYYYKHPEKKIKAATDKLEPTVAEPTEGETSSGDNGEEIDIAAPEEVEKEKSDKSVSEEKSDTVDADDNNKD